MAWPKKKKKLVQYPLLSYFNVFEGRNMRAHTHTHTHTHETLSPCKVVGTILSALFVYIIMINSTLWGRHSYYYHYTEEEVEAQRGEVVCSISLCFYINIIVITSIIIIISSRHHPGEGLRLQGLNGCIHMHKGNTQAVSLKSKLWAMNHDSFSSLIWVILYPKFPKSKLSSDVRNQE